jgi:hypothetical protein
VRELEKPDWRGLARELTQQTRAGDLALFMPGWHAKPFDYYASGALEICDSIPIPVTHDVNASLAAAAEAAAGRQRVWLVWETDHYTDPDGAIAHYLAQEMRQISVVPFPLVGKVILFQRGEGGA